MKVRKILAICLLLLTVLYAIFCFVKYKSGGLSVLSGIIAPVLFLASSALAVHISWSKKIENSLHKNKKGGL